MKRHPFDPVSFVAGLVVSLIGLVFLIPATPEGIFDLLGRAGPWFWAILLLAIGLAVIIPAVLGPRRSEPGYSEDPGSVGDEPDRMVR